MSNQAEVSGDRRGIINYTFVRGDTFAPPPVSFGQRSGATVTPEDFTGADITLTIRTTDKRVLFTLTLGSGISSPGTGVLQYLITADQIDAANLPPGLYRYDVQKEKDGIRQTIQAGAITLLPDETRTP